MIKPIPSLPDSRGPRWWLNTFKTAGQYWSDANAFAQAGSLAFFTLFSIAPLVIVLVSISGLFLGEEAARGQIVTQLEETIGREAATAVQQRLSDPARMAAESGAHWWALP